MVTQQILVLFFLVRVRVVQQTDGFSNGGEAVCFVAYKRLCFAPQVVGDITGQSFFITAARTSYETPYGQVECEWKSEGNKYLLHITVPANSEAVVCLPTEDLSKVSDYGCPVAGNPDFQFLGVVGGKAQLLVGSGEYLFVVR